MRHKIRGNEYNPAIPAVPHGHIMIVPVQEDDGFLLKDQKKGV